MSYAEHGPRIFLAGRPGNGVHSTYGDYVAPQKRSEGRLKMYESCTDIRAWSPNMLESMRYFRELNEHTAAVGISSDLSILSKSGLPSLIFGTLSRNWLDLRIDLFD